ncbi:MAG: fused protease/ribonucleoside-triphosphate reductase [Candidatus Zixiibacteriota bacterium]|nr:MAG: fused protease/ribonucleoside-triphosphate reductase [candidate division Zixibacteria bacterium]
MFPAVYSDSEARRVLSGLDSGVYEGRLFYRRKARPQIHKQFRLPDEFIEEYKKKPAPFGFGGLGYVVYLRTYSRVKEDGTNEKWYETVRRVVEGCYSLQKSHIIRHHGHWDEQKALRSAQRMYDLIFHGKFTPPGRGLWAMGTALTNEIGLMAALENCAFISTQHIAAEKSVPFQFMMDMSMLGVGVGFDTRGAEQAQVYNPDQRTVTYRISDDREGWVESIALLIESYLNPNCPRVEFDYTQIRPAGLPIRGFGGKSSGPGPLRMLHEDIRAVMNRRIGSALTSRDIVDLMNMIGRCVVAGNVRRTAQICLGDPEDEVYLDLKNYERFPERMEYGWTSNNSILAELGQDYSEAARRTWINGEPGYEWLKNAREYGRMMDPPDYADVRAMGVNPCSEQVLESYELCNLVETFPYRCESLREYLEVIKYAYLYAKTVTLAMTHWPETNEVKRRNRRIGLSMTGIAQFVEDRGLHQLREWCMKGYDTILQYDQMYSEWFGVPKSVRKTSIKPSGTVSLLFGATPGVHYPESRQYIRRMRLSARSELVPALREAGYHVEPAVSDPENTVVVSFPISLGDKIRTLDEVSMWEQLALVAFMQRYWADNQVSATVTFDQETEGSQIEHALNYYQYQLKSVSFLPRLKSGTAYLQMPYEAITEQEYREMTASLLPLADIVQAVDKQPDRFCDGDTCILNA